MNALPYLNAFTFKLLRVCSTFTELTREVSTHVLHSLLKLFHLPCLQVNVDDTLPLTQLVHTASGELVNSIFVMKGTLVHIPVIAINMSEELWESDAGKFDPKWWLVNGGHKSGEIQGYKHLLTFGNGPRSCNGEELCSD